MQGGEDRTRSEVDLCFVALDHAALLDRTARHLKLRRVDHLHDKPRHAFAAFHGVCRCVQERRMPGAAQETEEVIGINSRLLIGGLHVVGLAQVERNKTDIRLFLRDDTFLDIQQQQSVEVQHTRLEYTHDLDIRHGLAVERHRHGLHHTPEQ